MIRMLSLLTFILLLPACRSRPIQTVLRGAMNMTGDMSMDGDMRMIGDMHMSGDVATVMKTDNTASRLASVSVYASGNAGKVAVLDVDGLLINKNIGGLGSMGENPVALFREKLDALAADESVAAIVLRINSPGGGVTASDMMRRELTQFKQERQIPVVACVMDVGAGGAYYLATAADVIVAHPTSVVGGIGVILNVYYLEDAFTNFGVASIPIKAGDMIDVATPERMMEQPEREMLQQIADQFHQRFMDQVVASRPAVSEQVFDGRVLTGEQALEHRLVDQIGYLDDAVVLARRLAGMPQDGHVVMLRRDNDRAYTLFDVTPNSPTMSSLIPLKVPGLDRSKLPTFLYMWQPEPSMFTAEGG